MRRTRATKTPQPPSVPPLLCSPARTVDLARRFADARALLRGGRPIARCEAYLSILSRPLTHRLYISRVLSLSTAIIARGFCVALHVLAAHGLSQSPDALLTPWQHPEVFFFLSKTMLK